MIYVSQSEKFYVEFYKWLPNLTVLTVETAKGGFVRALVIFTTDLAVELVPFRSFFFSHLIKF